MQWQLKHDWFLPPQKLNLSVYLGPYACVVYGPFLVGFCFFQMLAFDGQLDLWFFFGMIGTVDMHCQLLSQRE